MANNLAHHLRLMLVTDDRLLAGREPVALLERAVRGGVTAVQLRLKEAGSRELVALAVRLRERLPVPVLLNDRPDLARVAGVGVHLGAEDLPVAVARRVLGSEAIIGATAGDAREAASAAGADYWGIGPWRTSPTKADAGAALGAEGFRAIVRLARGTPCIAIGGVQPDDVAAVLAAGGAGVAVVSGILGAADVEVAARRYAERLAAAGV